MTLAEEGATWIRISLDTKQLRPRTAEGYAYCLGLLAQHGFTHVDELTREKVYGFLEARRGLGIQPTTLNRNLAAVCSFVSWRERHGESSLDQLDQLRRLRYRCPPSKPPFHLRPEAAASLVAASQRVEPRLHRAVVLGLASGVRAGELSSFHHEDLHVTGDEPYAAVARDSEREGKTYRERTVPLRRADAAELLELGIGAPGKTGPVFPAEKVNATSRYIHPNTLGRNMAVARAVSGLPKIDFYTLRHTFASWHVQAGVSIVKVAKWLGNTVAVAERNYVALAPGYDPDCERMPT